MGKRKEALILLAEGFEEIEAVTPADVLRRAGVKVVLAGLKSKEVSGSRKIKVKADILLKDYKGHPDVLIVPGGYFGAKNLAASRKVKALIGQAFKKKILIASICASPAIVLGPTGILAGKKVTCYPGYEKHFPSDAKPARQVVVEDGNLITSRGPGTAFEFSKTIVRRLLDSAAARNLKEKMLYA